jgi:hypothetical protein
MVAQGIALGTKCHNFIFSTHEPSWQKYYPRMRRKIEFLAKAVHSGTMMLFTPNREPSCAGEKKYAISTQGDALGYK